MRVERGVIVICTGGGGFPVVSQEDGFHADILLLLTDVEAVYVNFGEPDARGIASIGAGTLRPEDFAKGSTGPKIEAAKQFAGSKGRRAAIGRLEDAMAILSEAAGTTVQQGNDLARYRTSKLDTSPIDQKGQSFAAK